jgi:hypothetical protein
VEPLTEAPYWIEKASVVAAREATRRAVENFMVEDLVVEKDVIKVVRWS